jgi:hypothetical protein
MDFDAFQPCVHLAFQDGQALLDHRGQRSPAASSGAWDIHAMGPRAVGPGVWTTELMARPLGLPIRLP